MTDAQKKYIELAQAGQLPDVLELISNNIESDRKQSFCGVRTGFLAWGRPIIPSEQNRLKLIYPERCSDFGTDGMVGMVEWVGRKIHSHYSDKSLQHLRLLVGDISAPRGGCLTGFTGRRGHASHTSGEDIDLGFLNPKPTAHEAERFSGAFDAKANWWLIKEIFKNPYACVKAVFMDRGLIRKLASAASKDPEWRTYRRLISHARGHRTHFHVRIGDYPGLPGCIEKKKICETKCNRSELAHAVPTRKRRRSIGL